MISALRAYINAHTNALRFSLSDLAKKPFATFLTVMVIATAFSLPTALSLLVKNAETVAGRMRHSVQISVFLSPALSREDEQSLLKRVRGHREVAFANFISPAAGLTQLEEQTGMTDVVSMLDKNPLPAVIEVHPRQVSQQSAKHLLGELKLIKGVEQVKLDLQWLQRLQSVIHFLWQFEWILFVFFASAIFLVVGNTIRLIIHHREREVEVFSLIGATPRFIRRPFIYSGIVYGFLGAFVALLMVEGFAYWLEGQAQIFARLYYQSLHIQSLSFQVVTGLLFTGAFLGFLGARLSLHRVINFYTP